jgi:hypothetical protein
MAVVVGAAMAQDASSVTIAMVVEVLESLGAGSIESAALIILGDTLEDAVASTAQTVLRGYSAAVAETSVTDVTSTVFHAIREAISNASSATATQSASSSVLGHSQASAVASDQWLGELSFLALVMRPDGSWVMTPGASELVRKLFLNNGEYVARYVQAEGDRRVVQQPSGLLAI